MSSLLLRNAFATFVLEHSIQSGRLLRKICHVKITSFCLQQEQIEALPRMSFRGAK